MFTWENISYVMLVYLLFLLYEFIIQKSIEPNKLRKYVIFVILAVYTGLGVHYSVTNRKAKNYKKSSYEIVKIDNKDYAIVEELTELNRFVVAEVEELSNKNIIINLKNLKFIEMTNHKVTKVDNFRDVMLKK